MSEWQETELGEVVLTANTGADAIKRAPIVIEDTGIRCLRIQDVSQSKTYSDWGFTKVSEINFNKFQLLKGDLFIARTGASVGVNLIIQENLDSVFNNGLIRIRVNEKTIPKYVSYILLSNYFKSFIINISRGTSTQPNIQIGSLLQLPINLPPLPEQHRIVAVLSTLDAKIDILQQQNHTLEQIAQTLFKRWFVDFEFPNEQGQPYKSSGGPMVASELEEIPAGWGVGILGDVVEITSSKRIFQSEYQESGILFYRSKEIIELHSGKRITTKLYISRERFNELDDKFGSPKEGDILLTSVGTIGIPYLVQKDDCFYFKDGNLTWFRNFKGDINGQFIYYWLKSKSAQQQITGVTIGSTQKALTIQALKGLDFCIPHTQLLKKYTNVLKRIVKKRNCNIQQIQTLTRLRDTLLPKLMSGKLRVSSLDD